MGRPQHFLQDDYFRSNSLAANLKIFKSSITLNKYKITVIISRKWAISTRIKIWRYNAIFFVKVCFRCLRKKKLISYVQKDLFSQLWALHVLMDITWIAHVFVHFEANFLAITICLLSPAISSQILMVLYNLTNFPLLE